MGSFHVMTNLNQFLKIFMFLWPSFFFPFSEMTVLDSPLSTNLTLSPHIPTKADALNFCFTEVPLTSPVLWIPFSYLVYISVSHIFILCLLLCFFSSTCKYTPFMPLSPVFSISQSHKLSFSFSHAYFPSSFRAFMFFLCLEYSFHFPLKQMLQLISICFSKYILPFIRNNWNS